MYTLRPSQRPAAHTAFSLFALIVCGTALLPTSSVTAQTREEILQKVESSTERIELTANTSRILTLQYRYARVQVNNPELITPTVLSANQVQISANRPGVTQLNLWDENGEVYSIDVIVYGDVQELEMALHREFPHASVQVRRYSGSLMLTGFVDSPEDAGLIQLFAEDYATKVINNIKVGGVQQIQLKVRIMEVSRTKLRELGVDFGVQNGNDWIVSSISGLIGGIPAIAAPTSGATFDLGIISDAASFDAVLNALRKYDLLKVLAEPTLITTSGRPASFNVGGEFPILVPQSLGTVSVVYRSFGTELDFVPLVLGNGNIRLEVRPRVSEIDPTRSVVIDDLTVPGLRVREVDTAVEMKPGQTLAIGGLLQSRVEAQNKGVPILSDMPWIGVAFRSVKETINEIELLILVQPELVDGMDPQDVPPGGPGMDTCSPSDIDLYRKGFLEVPCCEQCGGCGCMNCRHNSSYGPPFNSTIPVESEVISPGVSRSRSYVNPYVGASESRSANIVVASSQSVLRDQRIAYQRPTAASRKIAPDPPTSSNSTEKVKTAEPTFQSSRRNASSPGLVGPVGYDVQQ